MNKYQCFIDIILANQTKDVVFLTDRRSPALDLWAHLNARGFYALQEFVHLTYFANSQSQIHYALRALESVRNLV